MVQYNNMDKDQLKELLQKWLNGQASPKEHRMLQAWMVLAEKEEISISDDEKKMIQARLWNRLQPGDQEIVTQSKPRLLSISRQMMRYAALLAGVMIIGAGAFFLRYKIMDAVNPIALQTSTAGPYEIKEVLLPDGSVVTLSSGSSISYPERYRGPKRFAQLKGRAFFNVTSNAAAPFVVESDDVKVKVLGTSFEVNNTDAANEAQVIVATGKVQVDVNDKLAALLTQNQRMVFHKNDMLVDVNRNVDAGKMTSWINNELVFNDVPLTTVLQTIAADYGLKMQTANAAAGMRATFSGSFARKENWKDVLDVVCLSSGLTWSLSHENAIVIRKGS
jgi:ferric-dicitrate binding protein FerR (iron transport regulator)